MSNTGHLQAERAEQEAKHMHILADDKLANLWKWACGTQEEPAPNSTALCGKWSAGRAAPGQTWQNVTQYNDNNTGAHCPGCKAVADNLINKAEEDNYQAVCEAMDALSDKLQSK